MPGITVEDLRARRARLEQSRAENRQQLAACEQREVGYMFVIGELDLMIADLERRAAESEALQKEGEPGT